ncbi:hypothetical protein [Methanimicrococcus hongohii]|uniref:hypothetical protein n=1 Tax=Methanimicrococcus hongohii TaxID=3028295 RepID=UPI00292E76D6|nr:hypothetical protein [Methanimicrococcus sp. Hf6]
MRLSFAVSFRLSLLVCNCLLMLLLPNQVSVSAATIRFLLPLADQVSVRQLPLPRASRSNI